MSPATANVNVSSAGLTSKSTGMANTVANTSPKTVKAIAEAYLIPANLHSRGHRPKALLEKTARGVCAPRDGTQRPLGVAVTVRCHISVSRTPGDNRTLPGRASPAGQGHPCREGRRLLLGPPRRTHGLAPRVRGGLDLDRTLCDRNRRTRERLVLDEHLAGESASGCRRFDGLAIEATFQRVGSDVGMAKRRRVHVAADDEGGGPDSVAGLVGPFHQLTDRARRLGRRGVSGLANEPHAPLLVLLRHHVVRLPSVFIV